MTIVVGGPTGSGKSNLAYQLAVNIGGEVVNIDSVQLYKDHIIGSAAPDSQRINSIKHHLYGVLSGDTHCDLVSYLSLLNPVIKEIKAKGKIPIVTGGSTLYIASWLEGVDLAAKRDQELRDNLSILSTDNLYLRLQEINPERAKELHPNDRLRVTRAIEIATFSSDKSGMIQEPYADPVIILAPIWPRDKLYKRIEERTNYMLDCGLIDEVKDLFTRFGESWQCKNSLGYAQVLKSLNDAAINKQELSAEIAQATRRYAKRQMTFLRNAPKKYGWKVFPEILAKNFKDIALDSDVIYLGNESANLAKAKPQLKGFFCHKFSLNQLLSKIQESNKSPKQGLRELWYLDAVSLGCI